MIEIKELNKYYQIGKGKNTQKVHALKDVSLRIEDGEMVAVIGKSGAGKSTLLNILGLIDTYDSGSFLLDDTEIKGLKDSQTAKLRSEKIGFVLQDFSLIDSKSVLMNVMLPLLFGKCNYNEMKERAKKALAVVGIEDQTDKKTNQLSGGQKQRVAIARAMINNPNIILADEPTGALDTKTSAEIMEVFKQLNEKGKTVIIITHDPIVADVCKRKIEISDGRILEGIINKAVAE